MNKKTIDKLIPKAIKALSKIQNKDATIDKVNQGYLASFGPTVIASGIVKTVAIYIDESESNKQRKKVTNIMFSLINEDPKAFIQNVNSHTNYALKNKILEANIACKLAIRTFELKD
jgi:CRISPR/Cas system CMR-associated protein Cmr5 small subunit